MQQPVVIEVSDRVATLVLNRPDRLNALDPALAASLHEALRSVSVDDRVRCILIEGAGGNFMAGGDIEYFSRCLEQADGVGAEVFDDVHGSIRVLRATGKPVVAGIDGACAGFGISLLAACDLAVAADDALFTLAYCRLGVSPDGGSSWFLPRTVGLKRATELMLLGEHFSAGEAAAMGLVNRVVAAAQRADRTRELAERLAAGARLAQANAKALLNQSLSNDLQRQLELEEAAFTECARSADFAEGVRAFLDRRAPRFQSG